MCSNYDPQRNLDALQRFFGVERVSGYQPRTEGEAWPLGLAPFIRLAEDGSGNRMVEEGQFGLLPGFAKEVAFGRKTYNARSETVHQKPSFRESWATSRRCIIPASYVYEPCYETGKAVRWRVSLYDGSPMGIAGIYNHWRDADGVVRGTFAMLTVNADGHPVYARFHAPGDEKRMIVILRRDDYDRWLTCSPDEAREFFKQSGEDLVAEPAPLLRARKGAPRSG